MNTDGLNRWVTLGANIGVLLGIIFLAIEIQQNTESQEAEVRAANFFGIADTWRIPAESSELTSIMAKDAASESLTQAEEFQIQAFWTRIHLNIEWAYTEMPEDEFQRIPAFQKYTYDLFPSYRTAWERRRSFFDPEFVRYMDENVFND